MIFKHFIEFTRDMVPRVLRHVGPPKAFLIGFGIAAEFTGRTDVLAWVAFLLAAGVVLDRAMNAAQREHRAERDAEIDARVRAMLRAERKGDA